MHRTSAVRPAVARPRRLRGASTGLLLLLPLLACAAARPAGEGVTCAPGDGGARRIVLSPGAEPLRLSAAPLVLGPCRLPGDAARAVAAAASPDAAVLVLEGVQAPGDVTVRVFVDAPGATAATPTASPSFAGSFTLLRGGGGPPTVQVALAPALAAALRDDGAFTLTFVAVDAAGRAEDPGVRIARAVLELR